MRAEPTRRRMPLSEIDLFDPEPFRSGAQHDAFDTLRDEAPVWWQERARGEGFWSVTRYDDVHDVMKDHERFTSTHGTILDVLGGDPAGGRTINLMDPPVHTAVRVPAMRTLNAEMMRQRAPAVRQNVRRIVRRCLEAETTDFAPAVATLALTVMGPVMAIPDELWDDIALLAMTGVAPDDPLFTRGTTAETLHLVHHSLFAIFSDLIQDRRRRPGEDLISVLVGLDLQGRRMAPEQVMLNCFSFIMGANTTTPHVASHMLLVLMERPDMWRALVERPAGIEAVVEEGLRWASPTNHMMRRARMDVTIRGTTIAKGQAVCAWMAAANRDDRVFPDPHVFDPARSPNPHIAFGMGPHFCIGALAARMALGMLFEELAAEVDHFEPAGEPVHLFSNFINGITRLPVTWSRRRAPLAV